MKPIDPEVPTVHCGHYMRIGNGAKVFFMKEVLGSGIPRDLYHCKHSGSHYMTIKPELLQALSAWIDHYHESMPIREYLVKLFGCHNK